MKLRKVVLSVGWLLLGGCEFHASCGGRTLNMKNAEALVARAVALQLGTEPTVSCPPKVKVEQGARFDCEVTIDGVKGVATIVQKDEQTNVEVVQVTGLLLTGKLQNAIVERLQAQSGAKVEVDCGPRVRAAVVGETFRCQAKDDRGFSLEVEVKVKDTLGNVDFRVIDETIRGPALEVPTKAEAAGD
jgi:hypothetical protein